MFPSNKNKVRPRNMGILKSFKIWLFITMAGMILLALIFYASDVGTRVLDVDLQGPLLVSRMSNMDDFLNGPSIKMDDPRVSQKIYDKFLVAPAKQGPSHLYNLDKPIITDPSMGQSEQIKSILQNRTNGFFIECGALDGETRSNTLFLERFLNWTGLLIEADPLNFAQMVKKNRNAWLSPTCLSKTSYPQIASFKQDFNIGRIAGNKLGKLRPGYVDVQCFPIYSYLLALNVTHVDYFSLDIEGDELDVLKTLPLDKVNIETLSVEFAHVDDGKDSLRSYMESKGYKVVAEVTHPDWLANDFIFVKRPSS